MKGGHLTAEPVDLLWTDGEVRTFRSERHNTPHTHGTGCTFSAAITALLARQLTLTHAVEQAKSFISEAIRTAPGLGRGNGPVNHHAADETGAGYRDLVVRRNHQDHYEPYSKK